MASSRDWDGGGARVGIGVAFREVPTSVHEERLEEMKVLGVSLLPTNLSAIGC